jgi:hypothetical protein
VDVTRIGLAAVVLVGGCDGPCTFEEAIHEFTETHEYIDCQFAHHLLHESELVGGQVVHDCIVDAIARSKSFVGGYIIGGFEGSARYGYLGEASGGDVSLSYLTQGYSPNGTNTSLRRTTCASLATNTAGGENLGFECTGARLEKICD